MQITVTFHLSELVEKTPELSKNEKLENLKSALKRKKCQLPIKQPPKPTKTINNCKIGKITCNKIK